VVLGFEDLNRDLRSLRCHCVVDDCCSGFNPAFGSAVQDN